MGAEDANRLLSSSSTTVIRTEAKAAGENHVEGAVVNLPTETRTTETSQTSSSSTTAAAAATARN